MGLKPTISDMTFTVGWSQTAKDTNFSNSLWSQRQMIVQWSLVERYTLPSSASVRLSSHWSLADVTDKDIRITAPYLFVGNPEVFSCKQPFIRPTGGRVALLWFFRQRSNVLLPHRRMPEIINVCELSSEKSVIIRGKPVSMRANLSFWEPNNLFNN